MKTEFLNVENLSTHVPIWRDDLPENVTVVIAGERASDDPIVMFQEYVVEPFDDENVINRKREIAWKALAEEFKNHFKNASTVINEPFLFPFHARQEGNKIVFPIRVCITVLEAHHA